MSLYVFDETHVLHELSHYLPSQAPLKDFIHHNTLHAFQHLPFHEGIGKASAVFGYHVYMLQEEYCALYKSGKIKKGIVDKIIAEKYSLERHDEIHEKLINGVKNTSSSGEIGKLRERWREHLHINIDKNVHPVLFRFIGNYLDQGIALSEFPVDENGILASFRNLNMNSYNGFFKTERAKKYLAKKDLQLEDLLKILVGDERYYERYLFEQQFAHPGWSGMISVLEKESENLMKPRKISLKEFILFELLLELDAIDFKFGVNWKPLIHDTESNLLTDIFQAEENKELFEILALWQECFEWSFFDQVLTGLARYSKLPLKNEKSFQAVFCIDDREISFRRYLETEDPKCETFSSAGFFNVEFYFQPESAKFLTKSCPAPLTPAYLIKEKAGKIRHAKNVHFSGRNQHFLGGMISSSTVGFYAAFQLAKSIFYPSESSVAVASKNHMDDRGELSILNESADKIENGLQIGFTLDEMTQRMETFLKSIGLVNKFAPLIYIVGHGASSVNNTHFAGYDCGACSGRAGSVNARVAAWMLNNSEVRKKLAEKNIFIPNETQFIGALHDTTRDEIYYYDLDILVNENVKNHITNARVFENSLDKNAKERSRRFLVIDSFEEPTKVHDKVKLRAMSLFEPRPEWNHATNCLCIVAKREVTQNLFLDRRAFLQSYDYTLDDDGSLLLGIMKAIAPVCGGINLEYYFSKNDQYRLGAGTKLPHNVMGLIGVANGMDGDLRTGLPLQMLNIHDPLRLLVVVACPPEKLLSVLKSHDPTYEWFANNWIHLCALHPDTNEILRLNGDHFDKYSPVSEIISTDEIEKIVIRDSENLPAFELNKK